MKKINSIYIVGAVCLLLGLAVGTSLFSGKDETSSASGTDQEKEILYWVAPMDPNYKRDKPGKSPMGMDLIPVYAGGNDSVDEGPGTIQINPSVVNNLGVRSVQARRAPLNTEIRTVGYVKYDEDQLTHIHPRVEGWIEKLYVTASGDPVDLGQALYTLYSPQLVNAQEELILALNRNNQRLIQAAEDRLKALQLPSAFINTLKRNRQVEQSVTFYAPKSGVVDNLNIREGFFVKPGTTLMSIGTLDEVWVEAEVFERQTSLLNVGLPVTMTLDYIPGKVWSGEVGYVYPTLDEKTRTARVRLRFKNIDHQLKPNMFAQVVIHANSVENALIVPRESVIRTGRQDRVVLNLGKGAFKSVEVKLGRLTEDYAEILAGLNDGDSIVSSAQFLLDSESSKTSDFKRLNSQENMPKQVRVLADLIDVMPNMSMIKAKHESIPEWNWPEMTMNFLVSDQVDLSVLSAGMHAHITIEKNTDGDYVIHNVHVMSGGQESMSDEHMNHDTHQMNHDMPDMNHDMQNMNHGGHHD
ncbi:efflux RND transporter periplasmic adaptor subunit [Teredinibacter sp. KSP-S5-2]|uniref:efflux RND transporter periplasmic adaptor subunit n=1 Tax=Teredinibacter sp. KSP-S5-2 TaxID=3034506 RepID=UPI002934A753|nr:efflux RND transporter periplasmic adaptor subunit [Teredinibacter sp. KSP-S5-2]WNO11143.1 efflux RND transporter periplasmic adaptor subunit [Teredinibacter sp. KSP-S5-2]